MTTIWVVRFGNYEPAEIESLWLTEYEAAVRRDSLNGPNAAAPSGDWRVEEWKIGQPGAGDVT